MGDAVRAAPQAGSGAALQAYVKLLRAHGSVVARVERSLAASGLTLTQLGVLEAILHKGPLSHRALQAKVLTSAANLTDVVDKLAARGLVQRTRDTADRRRVTVELTEPGRSSIERLFPVHAQEIAAAMSGLDAAELATLDALLRKLGHGVGVAGPDAAHQLTCQPFDIERHGQETTR